MAVAPGRSVPLLFAIAAVALGVGLAWAPRAEYPHPLHVDEWFHFAHARAIAESGSASYVEPFYGERPNEDTLEIGFHLLLAWMSVGTGLDLATFAVAWPAALLGFSAFAAFAFGERRGFGGAAALLVAIAPTNVGILGPALVVPVALAFLTFPALLLLLDERPRPATAAVALAILGWLWLAHAPTGAAASLVAIAYAIAHGWEARSRGPDAAGGVRSAALLAVTALVAAGVFVARFPDLVGAETAALATGEARLFGEARPGVVAALDQFGYATLLLFVAGAFLLTRNGGPREWGLVASAVALYGVVIVGRLAGVGQGFLYIRGYVYLFLLASLLAAAGATGLATRAWARVTRGTRLASSPWGATAIVLVLLTLPAANALERDPGYYRVASRDDVEAFTWIRENLGPEYDRALLDPWKARAFPFLAGKHVFAMLPPRDDPALAGRIVEANRALEEGTLDAGKLSAAGVSLVYAKHLEPDPDLRALRPGVWAWCDPAREFRTGPCAAS